MDEDKSILSKEEAKNIILFNKDEMTHTFYSGPFGLLGADHNKKSLFDDIDKSFMCKKTGQQAMSMGHGLAIIPSKKCKQSDILFVETKQNFNKKELKLLNKKKWGVLDGSRFN